MVLAIFQILLFIFNYLINYSIKMVEMNKRIIVNGSRGVIKYKGPVEGTNGIWVGIDWDEEDRGKHDGSFQEKHYFKASTNKSGSFLREKDLDFGTELFNEIKEKYASELVENDEQKVNNAQNNVAGGVQWEFVKMEKIHRKQKDVFKLKCIVLSWSNVSHLDCENLGIISFKFCAELDLTKTLVGKWTQISTILSAFPSLKMLHLSDNRIEPLEECTEEEMQNLEKNLHFYAAITHLSLNRCRLTEYTANQLVRIFGNLIELYLAENELANFCPTIGVDLHLKLLDLQGNPLKEISRLKSIFKIESLEYLNLFSCQLDDIHFGLELDDGSVLPNLRTLILQNNLINQWNSVEQLENLRSLRKLILRGCPLSGARGVDSREIVIAKLPQIIDLDRCDISPVARRSAELLFLSRFASHPIEEEHRKTIQRLKLIYEYSNDQNEEQQKARKTIHSGIQSRRIFLIHGEQSLERTLSLALPIHKVVGLGARIFNFNPDELKGIELRRANPDYPSEIILRTKDNLLRQFDVGDGDKIVFI